jgi:predicted transglutaminase-like cysteine proteinase
MLGSAVTQFSRMGFAATVLTCMTLHGAAAQQLSSNMSPAGMSTSPPIGWVEFCERNARDCEVPAMRAASVTLDERTWRDHRQDQCRGQPRDRADHRHGPPWGGGTLVLPDDGKGDCEDYVLEKRRRLMRAGLPRQALLVTVVRDHKGDGHAVLTVATDRGDFILDNQAPKVLGWSETGYRYIKRQSQEPPSKLGFTWRLMTRPPLPARAADRRLGPVASPPSPSPDRTLYGAGLPPLEAGSNFFRGACSLKPTRTQPTNRNSRWPRRQPTSNTAAASAMPPATRPSGQRRRHPGPRIGTRARSTIDRPGHDQQWQRQPALAPVPEQQAKPDPLMGEHPDAFGDRGGKGKTDATSASNVPK